MNDSSATDQKREPGRDTAGEVADYVIDYMIRVFNRQIEKHCAAYRREGLEPPEESTIHSWSYQWTLASARAWVRALEKYRAPAVSPASNTGQTGADEAKE